MLKYEFMEYPDLLKDFDKMKKKEAEKYFNWYINEINNRILYLKTYMQKDIEGESIFDYTPESLIPLWEWFQTKIEFEEMTENEIQQELEDSPNRLKFLVLEDKRKISLNTLSIATDVANYFAEVFRKNNPSIYWGFFTKPKNRISVNEPVLLGFIGNDDLNPRLIISNCIWKSEEQKNPNMLYDIYHVWLEYILR